MWSACYLSPCSKTRGRSQRALVLVRRLKLYRPAAFNGGVVACQQNTSLVAPLGSCIISRVSIRDFFRSIPILSHGYCDRPTSYPKASHATELTSYHKLILARSVVIWLLYASFLDCWTFKLRIFELCQKKLSFQNLGTWPNFTNIKMRISSCKLMNSSWKLSHLDSYGIFKFHCPISWTSLAFS